MAKYNYAPRKPVLDRAVYNVEEIASLLDINLPRAYELARQPGFPAVLLSARRIVVPKEAFHRWLNDQAGNAAQSR
jgi:hypothetical protein